MSSNQISHESPLLTRDEAVKYLRLDSGGRPAPHRTLDYYRQHGGLVGVQIGREIVYRKEDLDAFIARKWKETSG